MNKTSEILFITTGSLATNPRLVKEFETLKSNVKCHVMYFLSDDWSMALTKEIKLRNPEVNFIEIDRKKIFLETIVSRVLHKIAIVFNSFFKNNPQICAFANNDKAPQLWFKTKRLFKNVNLSRVIAHNLGAFYPAYKLAINSSIKLQLDIEDYHPGEALYFNEKHEYKNRIVIMQSTFNSADAITYASEGIKLKCETVFNFKQQTKRAVIINSFRSDDFPEPIAINKEINFVWFSQNISPKRGLEEVFEVAKEFSNIKFHLIGKPDQNFIERMEISDNVVIHSPMSQDKLHEFLSKMDVGLALENRDVDGNRDICLTNKFLAYAQAGLFILATDTFGQTHFLKKLGKQAGIIIETSLSDEIRQLNRELLQHSYKVERWKRAKVFSWETQSNILKEMVK
ncbi:glycosyltransferase [Gelidibacter sp. F63206]|uniref:glycosyltransferase n=1 Tax=Gelidibacter sp. F63206 TaxID=2926425 RepID=UPI001FF66336|nr:glycosyltransferase [Gelidibacter sp. F63206]MCK0115081.1 glycosyltransferase [Gelidibacter sp. F63206]